MSKRNPAKQLTRDDHYEDDEEEPQEGIKFASESVIASRRIIPRKKAAKSTPYSNPFAAIAPVCIN